MANQSTHGLKLSKEVAKASAKRDAGFQESGSTTGRPLYRPRAGIQGFKGGALSAAFNTRPVSHESRGLAHAHKGSRAPQTEEATAKEREICRVASLQHTPCGLNGFMQVAKNEQGFTSQGRSLHRSDEAVMAESWPQPTEGRGKV